jgi:hypothetical protein
MASSQSNDGVNPMSANKSFTMLNRPQRLSFTLINWSPEVGFSSILADEDIISGLKSPLPSSAKAVEGCYRISKAPGKGLGMFATKDIKPGDRILVENPLLVTPKQIMPDLPIPPSLMYNVLIAPYQDTPAFDAFFSLPNCYPLTKESLPFGDFAATAKKTISLDPGVARGLPFTSKASVSPEDVTVTDVKDAKAIAESNALDIQIHDPKWNADVAVTHKAVFLNATRINHR